MTLASTVERDYLSCAPPLGYHRAVPLQFDTRQLPEIQAFLASLNPSDELAYRMALRGLFPRCRGREWDARIDELRAELVKDTKAAERFARRARDIREKIKPGG